MLSEFDAEELRINPEPRNEEIEVKTKIWVSESFIHASIFSVTGSMLTKVFQLEWLLHSQLINTNDFVLI